MNGFIEVDDVSKAYGSGEEELSVIDGIHFTVERNELVVVVGPSGCGKTTLLKLIDGLLSPTTGEVRVDGEPVDSPRRDVAMVFQEFNLLPWRTAMGNVEFGLEVQGTPEDVRRDRSAEWIRRVGLEGFEDSYPHELSGGMKQRIGLARALAVDPDVLLMDEPFGSLDAQTKDRLQTELLHLLGEAETTVVYITHDIREAILLADRVLVMSSKPSTIVLDRSIEIPRPRWNRRFEIETSDRFGEYEAEIRRTLGLTIGSMAPDDRTGASERPAEVGNDGGRTEVETPANDPEGVKTPANDPETPPNDPESVETPANDPKG